MMYPYLTFGNGTEMVHSDIIEDDGNRKVLIHFERPTEDGFDSIRCELPSYTWTPWEGHFSAEEIETLEQFLRDNAHLIFKYASEGGLKVA